MARGKNRKYSFQQYMTEAKVRPFVLETGQEDPAEITVQPPDGDTLLAISEVGDRPRQVLELLCGDQHEAVMDLLGPAPADVTVALIKDMTAHFGLSGDPGDSRASSN